MTEVFLTYKGERNIHSDYIMTFIGKIFYDIENEDPVEVGKIRLIKVNGTRANNEGINLFDQFDAVDDDMTLTYETLYEDDRLHDDLNLDKREYFLDDLLIIEHIIINKEFRGKKIGKEAIKAVCEDFYNNLIVLQAIPLQINSEEGDFTDLESDPEKANKKLRSYYESIGFERFKDTNFYTLSPVTDL